MKNSNFYKLAKKNWKQEKWVYNGALCIVLRFGQVPISGCRCTVIQLLISCGHLLIMVVFILRIFSLKSEGNLVSGLILQPEDKAECGNKIQPERWLKYVYERKEKNV